MKITDLLDESSIILNLEASSKEDALNALNGDKVLVEIIEEKNKIKF